jgi:hypothetical protein
MYAVITLVMLAMGTGCVLPTRPRLPTPSMVRAAEPVVGQGRDGVVPGKCTDVVTAGRNTGRGTARVHSSPAKTPSTATRRTRPIGMSQRRARPDDRAGESERRSRLWAGARRVLDERRLTILSHSSHRLPLEIISPPMRPIQ